MIGMWYVDAVPSQLRIKEKPHIHSGAVVAALPEEFGVDGL